jgi:hypothetical protein
MIDLSKIIMSAPGYGKEGRRDVQPFFFGGFVVLLKEEVHDHER